MTWNEIVSAICICISAVIFSTSLIKDSKKEMFWIQAFSCITYVSNYAFLLITRPSALIGLITAICEAFRLIAFGINGAYIYFFWSGSTASGKAAKESNCRQNKTNNLFHFFITFLNFMARPLSLPNLQLREFLCQCGGVPDFRRQLPLPLRGLECSG